MSAIGIPTVGIALYELEHNSLIWCDEAIPMKGIICRLDLKLYRYVNAV